MLKIKLTRYGKKKQPHYRIVVNEARDKRDGSYTAQVGHYAPSQQPKELVVDLEAYDEWMEKGAQPTDSVRTLVARFRRNPEDPFPAEERAAKEEKKAAKKQADQAPEEEASTEDDAPAEEKAAEDESTEAADEKEDEKEEEKEDKKEKKE